MCEGFTTYMTLICALALFWVFIAPCLMFRNDWVSTVRLELIKLHTLEEYIGYDEMLVRFWIWDVNKLRKKI